jgi:predicted LPLAT superfamily acyltransferase
MRVGGKARGYHIAAAVALWYVLFYPSIRRRCSFYLRRRFPARSAWWQRLLDTHRLIHAYGQTLADMKVLELFGPSAFSVTSPQHEQLIQLCSRDRGLIVLQAHAGCWQIAMSTLREFPKPVSIVMVPEDRTSTLFGSASIVDPRSGLEGVLAMTQALLQGQILALMGDRTFGSNQTAAPVQFLGSPALFPITPYRLASATNTPVLVLLAPKTGRETFELRLAKVIDVPPNLGRDPSAYAPYAQQFADCLEQFAREFPNQVYNFYDLWAADPATTVHSGTRPKSIPLV